MGTPTAVLATTRYVEPTLERIKYDIEWLENVLEQTIRVGGTVIIDLVSGSGKRYIPRVQGEEGEGFLKNSSDTRTRTWLERLTLELTAVLKECLGWGFGQVEEEFLDSIEEDNEIAKQEDSLIPHMLDKPTIEDEQDDVTT